MRRADRLFQIVQILRNRRIVKARDLADRLQVSERTIYRDIQDLSLSGVPVEGEAGVGYCLRYSLDLPPLLFDAAEIEALVLGMRMVQTWSSPQLTQAAASILDKVEAVLPKELKHLNANTRMFSPKFPEELPVGSVIDTIRSAINQYQQLLFAYQREDGEKSQRCINPLGLFFWGKVWTLIGWCHLRDDFRHFRLDRMQQVQLSSQTFQVQSGQSLQDFFRTLPDDCR